MRLQSSYFSAAVLAVLLTACGTTGPTRFYTLAGPVAATATAPESRPARQRLLIEVLPVSVPERLARPQIVVRTDEARVDILEQDRWSAPLNNELRDALASGIANRLGAIDVTRSGRPANQPAYRIAVELRQLDAVCETWGASPTRKVILNLPSTVECSTPNVYADQIEWMHRNLKQRSHAIISVHPHNDRGTAVASAELAVMAGAERVEGCLFGNGERTGNVDLVTLGLNLYTQGVHPGLDFSDIDSIRKCVEECNQIPVHPRHPYVGDLVFTAFSGSHQDAIKKGLAVQKADAIWEVPYLPIDPADLGRSYDAVIRVNSQSGKGGMAYLLEQEYGLSLPRRLQIEFSRAIQREADASGKEIAAADIHAIFRHEYLERQAPYAYRAHRMSEDTAHEQSIKIEVDINRDGKPVTLRGTGNGPIDAFVNALQLDIKLMDFHEHSIGAGANAQAASYIELRLNEAPTGFGVGIDANIVTASFKAVLSAINRQIAIDQSVNQAAAPTAQAA